MLTAVGRDGLLFWCNAFNPLIPTGSVPEGFTGWWRLDLAKVFARSESPVERLIAHLPGSPAGETCVDDCGQLAEKVYEGDYYCRPWRDWVSSTCRAGTASWCKRTKGVNSMPQYQFIEPCGCRHVVEEQDLPRALAAFLGDARANYRGHAVQGGICVDGTGTPLGIFTATVELAQLHWQCRLEGPTCYLRDHVLRWRPGPLGGGTAPPPGRRPSPRSPRGRGDVSRPSGSLAGPPIGPSPAPEKWPKTHRLCLQCKRHSRVPRITSQTSSRNPNPPPNSRPPGPAPHPPPRTSWANSGTPTPGRNESPDDHHHNPKLPTCRRPAPRPGLNQGPSLESYPGPTWEPRVNQSCPRINCRQSRPRAPACTSPAAPTRSARSTPNNLLASHLATGRPALISRTRDPGPTPGERRRSPSPLTPPHPPRASRKIPPDQQAHPNLPPTPPSPNSSATPATRSQPQVLRPASGRLENRPKTRRFRLPCKRHSICIYS